MSKSSFSTPSKKKIRKEWNLPIISLIKEITGKKLVYLGLPSPDADDIFDWIEYIENVIAFQCRKYPEPSDQTQDKSAIIELEAKLNTLETEGKINTFMIYDGYIEEVLLKGRDTSNNKFEQTEVITLYNLDYCNSLSLPIVYLDSNGNVKQGFKFDSIKKLMELQNQLPFNSKKFILFLTIKCDYYEPEMSDILTDGCDSTLQTIHKQYEQISNPLERKARQLRSYTIQNLSSFFKSNGFIPEFLPTINYNGKPMPGNRGDFILLHFAVLGTQMKQSAGVAPFYQNISDLINQNFIYIRDGVISENTLTELKESSVEFTPENYIKESESFKRHWIIEE